MRWYFPRLVHEFSSISPASSSDWATAAQRLRKITPSDQVETREQWTVENNFVQEITIITHYATIQENTSHPGWYTNLTKIMLVGKWWILYNSPFGGGPIRHSGAPIDLSWIQCQMQGNNELVIVDGEINKIVDHREQHLNEWMKWQWRTMRSSFGKFIIRLIIVEPYLDRLVIGIKRNETFLKGEDFI